MSSEQPEQPTTPRKSERARDAWAVSSAFDAIMERRRARRGPNFPRPDAEEDSTAEGTLRVPGSPRVSGSALTSPRTPDLSNLTLEERRGKNEV
jgi:hypothetical protein